MPAPSLVLASSSAYRQQQLRQLGLTFTTASPDVDETPLPGESAKELACRLALAKAKKIFLQHPDSLVIGSDQTADLNGTFLGKPMTEERAIAQLTACSGKTVHFWTAAALISGQRQRVEVIDTEVRFRQLSDSQIRAYIRKEEPLYCAGSFKCESLGIALFESIQSTDPSALIGLPLIVLTQMLNDEGLDVLSL